MILRAVNIFYILNIISFCLACYAFQIRGSEYPKEMYQTIIRDHQSRYEEERGIQNDDD